jgi:hypothetical protein
MKFFAVVVVRLSDNADFCYGSKHSIVPSFYLVQFRWKEVLNLRLTPIAQKFVNFSFKIVE